MYDTPTPPTPPPPPPLAPSPPPDTAGFTHLANASDACTVIYDQCRALDNPRDAASAGRKATALLASGNVCAPVRRIFGGLRCNHPHGTHKRLGGADEHGNYRTKGTERYSATNCAMFAECIREGLKLTMNTSIDRGEVTAAKSIYHEASACKHLVTQARRGPWQVL